MTRREIIKAIKKLNGNLVREGSRHSIYRCACGKGMTSVQRHKGDFPKGTVRKIEKDLASPSGCFAPGWLLGRKN